jgi:hypothetical protein
MLISTMGSLHDFWQFIMKEFAKVIFYALFVGSLIMLNASIISGIFSSNDYIINFVKRDL